MKIRTLELFKVPPRWLFLKITTEDGISGWGEPVVEGRAATVETAIKELEPLLIGTDADRIEDTWQKLYRGGFYRGGPVLMSAIAGIDQALWDIKGKRLGTSVFELLGGAVRDRMLVYQWIGGDRPSHVAEAALEKKKQGFQAVKMNGTSEMEWIDTHQKIDEVVERIGTIREACGNDFGIGVDFHGRVHKTMARIIIKEIEQFKPMFVEEPVLPENFEYFQQLAEQTTIPLATGERMYSRWDFKPLFHLGGVDIIQPDLSHAGGISEVKKIASLAEMHDITLAPHCPLGPVALASSLQVDFTCVNAFIQETSIGIHYNVGADLLDYLLNPEIFDIHNGYISLFKGAGLGVDINEEKVREMNEKWKDWKNPVWRTESGVITEW